MAQVPPIRGDGGSMFAITNVAAAAAGDFTGGEPGFHLLMAPKGNRS